MGHKIECPMLRAYLECALWSSCEYDEDGNDGAPLDDNYGIEDISPESLASAQNDVSAFLADHADDIGSNLKQAGYDFWLTRNGHGAGFWDGDWPHDVGTRLTKASKVYGTVNLYVGDDGKIYGF